MFAKARYKYLKKKNLTLFLLLIFFNIKAQPPTTPTPSKSPSTSTQPSTNSGSEVNKIFKPKNEESEKKIQNEDVSFKKDISDDETIDKVIKKIPNLVYGGDLFSDGTKAAQFAEITTPPDDYKIGYGDHILFAYWGDEEAQHDYIVYKDGSIFPEGIGKIFVSGLTFNEARSIINAKFKPYLQKTTRTQVTIGQIRSVVVNITGNVNKQGPQTVSAFSNPLNVLSLAGGINKFGNLREILVKRNGAIINSIDIYKYLRDGDLGRATYLENGDFIIVGDYDKMVEVKGEFRRPMFYQLKKNEGLKDLIKFVGGFTSNALKSNLKLYRTVNELPSLKDINYDDLLKKSDREDYIMQDGDIVIAEKVNEGLTNRVEIEGPIAYPGIYQTNLNGRDGKNTIRLFDLIDKAGGLAQAAYLDRAFVFLGGADSNNLKVERVEIDLNDYANGKRNSKYNVVLNAFDKVKLFDKNYFREKLYVEVIGEVRSPGKYSISDSLTLQDVLYLSGGLKSTAEFGKLEISRVLDIDSAKYNLKPVRVVINSFEILPELELSEISKTIYLRPFDQIIIRTNPQFELQQNIEMKGQIIYPGLYPKLNKSERISSFIKRSGGLKVNANIDGAVLYRTKIESPDVNVTNNEKIESMRINTPISINLEKAMANKNSKWDLVLRGGDIIYIPETNPFVEIKGAVQSPLKTNFDKEHTTLNYYIDKAGGFGIRPWRSRAYITYANGKSRKTTNFIFHFYPKVKEGSIITIPQKPENKNEIISGDFLKSLMAGIITTATTIVIIKNTK